MKPGRYSRGEIFNEAASRDRVVERDGKRYREYMSPHNPDAVMMRLPEIEQKDGLLNAKQSGDKYKHRRKTLDYPPMPKSELEVTFDWDNSNDKRGEIVQHFLRKDAAAGRLKKRKGFFQDPMADAYEEIERRISAEVAEKDKEKTQELIKELADNLDPAKIKMRATLLAGTSVAEIMQWGWSVEKMFARRQDEIHGDYIKGGVNAKSHTKDVTDRIKKITKNDKAGLLKRAWLRTTRRLKEADAIIKQFNDTGEKYFCLLTPKERFVKMLGFIADLERAVEDDITIAQDQIGFCTAASGEMDQFYNALKAYDRELKRNREAIMATAREQSAARFDPDDEFMRTMHETEILDAEKNIDERSGYLELALEKCRGEYGFYVSAMKHEKLAIDALQQLMHDRLPQLEAQVKRGIKISEAQEAMKARGAGRSIDPEFDFTPEQATNELKAIAAMVTLQIDAVEKLHAAIIHDEQLVIEGKEPTALVEHRPVLMLAAPSKHEL